MTNQVISNDILQTAESLRWQMGQNFHEQVMEDIYTDAARLADRAVTRPDKPARFDLDRAIDRIVTSRIWGFPMMLLLFTLVFWLTISGANVPSARPDSCRDRVRNRIRRSCNRLYRYRRDHGEDRC